jgi:sugar phosphate isomerase/epimerase
MVFIATKRMPAAHEGQQAASCGKLFGIRPGQSNPQPRFLFSCGVETRPDVRLNAAMKFAICNEIYGGWKIDDIFAHAAKAGYDAVEIAPFTISKHVYDIGAGQRRSIAESAARAQIAISGIHWVLAQTEGLHLTHPDGAVRDKTSDYLGALVDFCADIGGRFMVVGSPKQRSVMEGVTHDQAWNWALTSFQEPLKRAEQRQVTICFEPLAPVETNFVNTAAEAIRFVQQSASPNFKIILDVKAMCSEAKPIPLIIRESWPHFAYFHANDKNLKGPGFGDVDFGPIGAALKEVGYAGFVSVEVFNFDEGPEVIASRSIEYLRQKLT